MGSMHGEADVGGMPGSFCSSSVMTEAFATILAFRKEDSVSFEKTLKHVSIYVGKADSIVGGRNTHTKL